jgi:hypothetical protein
MVATGTLLFYAIPIRSYHRIWFRTKMILWFDCDKPQPPVVVWTAGCDAYPKSR